MRRRGGVSARTGWAAMRPVLVGFLLVADAFAVASLAIARPGRLAAALLAFGSLLLGLVWFEVWAIATPARRR